MIIVDLRARAFQVTVVIQQLQSPQKLLRTIARERDDLRRTQKTIPMNQTDDFTVALGDLYGVNERCAFETRKTVRHPSIILEGKRAAKASGFALLGQLEGILSFPGVSAEIAVNRRRIIQHLFPVECTAYGCELVPLSKPAKIILW